jgi:hypothetical protein
MLSLFYLWESFVSSVSLLVLRAALFSSHTHTLPDGEVCNTEHKTLVQNAKQRDRMSSLLRTPLHFVETSRRIC